MMQGPARPRTWGGLPARASFPGRLLLLILLPAVAFAQGVPQRIPVTASKGWQVPRTPDGVPDLQGVWTNATVTPLQRANNLAAKEFFTEEEARAFERETAQRNNADVRGATAAQDVGTAYNAFWYDRGNQVVPTLRTSLIIDPPNGRIPALTEDGQKRQAARLAERRQRGPADGPESRSLAERCIVWPNAGPPMVSSFYNNNYQIVQGPGYVVILVEMIHDARVIPTDGRPHAPAGIRQWLGDSIGRWEGDTLVIETTNFTPDTAYQGSSKDMKLIERFRRVNNDVLMYEFTIDDPATFTRPWTAQIPMTPAEGRIFEYACHEGNYAMEGMLAGARQEEERAAQRKEE
jgi:hypothetical protein